MSDLTCSLDSADITRLGVCSLPSPVPLWLTAYMTHLSLRVPLPILRSTSSSLCISLGNCLFGVWGHPEPCSSWESVVSIKEECFVGCQGPAKMLPLRPAPTQYSSRHLCTYSGLLTISAFSVTCWNGNARSLGCCSPFSYINLSHTRCGSLVFRKTNWCHQSQSQYFYCCAFFKTHTQKNK